MAEARLTGSRRLRAVLLGKWSIRLLVLLLLIVLALLGIPHLGRPVGLESVFSPGDPQGPPAILDERFAGEDGHELCQRMLAAGLPAGPVMHVDEAMAAAHTAHREMVTELGDFRGLGTPIKLSRTPGGTRAAPPRFNEHGEAVLAEGGFSAEEIKALRASGVLVEARRK